MHRIGADIITDDLPSLIEQLRDKLGNRSEKLLNFVLEVWRRYPLLGAVEWHNRNWKFYRIAWTSALPVAAVSPGLIYFDESLNCKRVKRRDCVIETLWRLVPDRLGKYFNSRYKISPPPPYTYYLQKIQYKSRRTWLAKTYDNIYYIWSGSRWLMQYYGSLKDITEIEELWLDGYDESPLELVDLIVG